jgi:ferredoxin
MHRDVRLAEQVYLEETGQVQETTDASNAFRNTGRPLNDLYAGAIALRHRFALLGSLLGGWTGLVVGVKLVVLCVRRRRTEYAPDPALCVSCGRCFEYCPPELERRGLIQDVAAGTGN